MMTKPMERLLTPEQKQALLQKSDAQGWLCLLRSWGLIAAAFLLAGLWPNPVSLLLAVILLGGGQVGLAILMHDASHAAMFSTPVLNRQVGRWLCASPVFTSLDGYRKYHMQHHRKAGTVEDPDEYLTARYPVSRASMRRKLLRDICGITGFRQYTAAFLMYADYYVYQLNGQMQRSENHAEPLSCHLQSLFRNGHAILVSNLVLLGVLWLCGAAWLYLVWLVALFTSFQLYLRLRQIGDHAMVPDRLDTDPLRHARSIDAAWWERLLISPHNEHFHLEHHLLPGAPSYNLPRLRQILLDAGRMPADAHARTYVDVLRLAIL